MGNIETAVKITSEVKRGRCNRLTTFSNGFTVETWWNRSARSWVVQIKDQNGNQVGTNDLDPAGPAEYVGHRLTAGACHHAAIRLVRTASGK